MAEMWCTEQEFKNVAVVLADSVKNGIITTAQVNEIIVECTADLKQLLTGVYDLDELPQNVTTIDTNNTLLLQFDNLADPVTYSDISPNENVVTPQPIGDKPLQQSAIKKFGGAASLDGSTQFLEITNDDSLQLTEDFTIECWIYLNDYATSSVFFNHSIDESNRYVFFATAGSGLMKFQVRKLSVIEIDLAGAAVPLNEWHHVAVSRNGDTIRIYLDGVIQDTDTSGLIFDTYTSDPCIGKYEYSSSTLNGYPDDFRISNIARYGASNFTPSSVPLSKYLDNSELIPPALVKLTKLKSAIMAVDRYGLNNKLRESWDMEYRDTLEIVQSGILLDSDDNEIESLGQPELIRGNDPDILRDIYQDSDRYGQRILTETD